MEQIQLGKQDIVFAGGGEEEHWALSCLFDAMGALSSKYNDTPEKASRTYDADRDGFVISGGGGALVLEEYEHAKARGQKYTLKSLVMVQPAMGPIWSPHLVRVRFDACNWLQKA